MTISYNKGFSIAAMFMAIAAFFGIGAHVTNNMQATTTDSSVVQTSATSDWETYTNSQYGFSFKYPANWSLCTSSSDVEYARVSGDCNASKNNQADYFMVRNIGDLDLGNLESGALKQDTGWNVFTGNAQMRAVYFQSKNINLVSVAVNAQDKDLLNKISGSFNLPSASYNSPNPNMSGGLNVNAGASASSRAGATNPNMSGGLNVNSNADTSDWKTYSGAGFSVNYPGDLGVFASQDSSLVDIQFGSSKDAASRFTIEVIPNSSVSAQTYASQLLEVSSIPSMNAKAEALADGSVGGVNGKFIQLTSLKINKIDSTHILLQKGNSRYEIIGVGDYATGPTFQHFYQSFKFTN